MTAAPYSFPPASLGEWRRLDDPGRRAWLTQASRRFFDVARDIVPSKVPGRVIVLEGRLVDTLLGFYCAMGEAVNGPGGYFGSSMQAFDDCLFTGFGLEYPYSIVWKDTHLSKEALDATLLLQYLEIECSGDLELPGFEEGKVWRDETRREALAGTRTMFDEIVATIQSVPERGGGSVTLMLE